MFKYDVRTLFLDTLGTHRRLQNTRNDSLRPFADLTARAKSPSSRLLPALPLHRRSAGPGQLQMHQIRDFDQILASTTKITFRVPDPDSIRFIIILLDS